MTVEHLTPCPVHDLGIDVLKFCDQHDSVLDALVQQRNLTANDRMEVVQSLLVGVVTIMGPLVFGQHDGCPVCVLEGTLERSADELAMRRRKTN